MQPHFINLNCIPMLWRDFIRFQLQPHATVRCWLQTHALNFNCNSLPRCDFSYNVMLSILIATPSCGVISIATSCYRFQLEPHPMMRFSVQPHVIDFSCSVILWCDLYCNPTLSILIVTPPYDAISFDFNCNPMLSCGLSCNPMLSILIATPWSGAIPVTASCYRF